jgi:hypothetical protein
MDFISKKKWYSFTAAGGGWITAIVLIIILCWLPFLRFPGKFGDFVDWDFFLANYEAIRKTIVEYGQFPFWNPWHFGGTPLFANPQIGVISLETLCSIIFGTVYGLRISMLLYTICGAVGMWFLLGDYAKNPMARFWGAIIFSLSGGLALHMSAGHTVMNSITLLPWMIFCLRRLNHSISAALWLGFLAGMAINHSVHYSTFITASFGGLFFIAEWVRNIKSKQFVINAFLALLALTLVGFYRLIVTLKYGAEFPRIIEMRLDIGLHHYLLALIYPGQYLLTFPDVVKDYWSWFEIGCYVGIIAITVFLISIIREIKWWHWGFLIASLLTINSSCKWLPGYWLREIPPFTSFFCISRWRFLAVFFIAFGCCRGLDWLLDKFPETKPRRRIYFLVLLSLCGLTYNQYCNWTKMVWINEKDIIAQVKESSSSIITVNNHAYSRYASVHQGVAQLFDFEPMLGYMRDYKNKRFAADNKYYKGELFALKGKISSVDWSPNRVTISCSEPTAVLVNQNPGNYWRDEFDQAIFPELKGFDTDKHFIVKAEQPGVIVLRAIPPVHTIGLLVSAGAGILLLAILLSMRISERRKNSPANPVQ